MVDVEKGVKERVSRPRLLIAQVLGDMRRFVSAQQIVEVLKCRNLKVGTATVYRNLKLMAEQGSTSSTSMTRRSTVNARMTSAITMSSVAYAGALWKSRCRDLSGGLTRRWSIYIIGMSTMIWRVSVSA